MSNDESSQTEGPDLSCRSPVVGPVGLLGLELPLCARHGCLGLYLNTRIIICSQNRRFDKMPTTAVSGVILQLFPPPPAPQDW